MESSPALDVFAIGYSDGHIRLLNILHNYQYFTLRAPPGPITCLSFRKDASQQSFHMLSSGDALGNVHLWDLTNQRLLHSLHTKNTTRAHSAPVTRVQFLPNEPLLVTSGSDNTLCSWTLDEADRAVQKNILQGHKQPPIKIEFYDPLGHYVLTSGLDSTLRLTCIDASRHHRSILINNGNHQHNVTVATDFDVNYLRHGDWHNVITIQRDSSSVELYNVQKNARSKKSAYRDLTSHGTSSSTCLSHCGNYMMIGRSSGKLEKWNVQSVTFKQEFKNDKSDDKHVHAHSGIVTCCTIDNQNKVVISGGFDGELKFWDLHSARLLTKHTLPTSISKIKKSKINSNLIACACDDHNILIFDSNTHHHIRTMKATSKVSDLCFSHDARLLVACMMTGDLKVWDVVSGSLVDWINVDVPATSVSFHPEGLYLATSHVGQVGICLWINKMCFGDGVVLQNAFASVRVDLPTCGEVTFSNRDLKIENGDRERANVKKRARELMSDGDDESQDEMEMDHVRISNQDLELKSARLTLLNKELNSMVHLSGLPKNKWQSLLHLDQSRSKNKSKDDQIVAPFFLGVQQGFTPKFKRRGLADELEGDSNGDENDSLPIVFDSNSDSSEFIKNLKSQNVDLFLKFIKSVHIKQIDVAIRCLSALDQMKQHILFLDFLIGALRLGRDYDLVQALMNLYLQVHGELISKLDGGEFFEKLDELRQCHEDCWFRVHELIQNDACMIRF
ncbi:U3 small nucleolar RNA-associated protein 21, partial [Acrasis kona]